MDQNNNTSQQLGYNNSSPPPATPPVGESAPAPADASFTPQSMHVPVPQEQASQSGAQVPLQPQQNQHQQQPAPGQDAPDQNLTDPNSLDQHKTLAIVGYVVAFLFFLPLVNDASKHNQFARFHAGQQLNFLIMLIVIWVATSMFSFMFMMVPGLVFVVMLLNLGFFVAWVALTVIGIINVVNGQMKQLPIIGHFTILK